MVKYLILFLFVIFFGCEMNSEQLVKPINQDINIIKFDAVSKNLIFENFQEGINVDIAKKEITNWFDNKIKINGFDGSLTVLVNSIVIDEIKKDEYYRFQITINIHLIESSETLNSKKLYKINSKEYGEINGSFSISDQETLNINTIKKSIKNINKRLLEM